MKKLTPASYAALLALLLLSTALGGCLRDECERTQTYVRYNPVYKLPQDFRKGVTAEAPRALTNPGKIYAFGQYLLINEREKGIHVIDNSNPQQPQNIAFWAIPGNVDVAVRGNYLYADQYVDLLTLDISDLQQPRVVCTEQDAFQLFGFRPERGYLVGYEPSNTTEVLRCDDGRWGQTRFFEGDVLFSAETTSNVNVWVSSAYAPGIAGSFARFGQSGDFLYTIDNTTLRSWSVSNPSCPVQRDEVQVGWNIETVFPWKDRLFIGSQRGVFVFNNQNPAQPAFEAAFEHATGCDPVVCDDNNAYVTIHSGTTCNAQNINQLDVLDIRNLPNVDLTRSYAMTEPKGLCVTNAHLFVCDDGLKIYDKTNPANLQLLSHLNTLKTYDVIAFSDTHLLVVGEGGFYQFDVSNPAAPLQLSLLPVVK